MMSAQFCCSISCIKDVLNLRIILLVSLLCVLVIPYFVFRNMCSPMFVGTSKEKFNYHNTLLCLVKAMQGHNITIDLRNDSYICGSVITVDGYMNISLVNAVYCDPQGKEYLFENLFVQARNIRYVHIPEMMPIIGTINKEFTGNRIREPVEKPVQKSRKAKKALQQHMQTVALLDTPTNVPGKS